MRSREGMRSMQRQRARLPRNGTCADIECWFYIQKYRMAPDRQDSKGDMRFIFVMRHRVGGAWGERRGMLNVGWDMVNVL